MELREWHTVMISLESVADCELNATEIRRKYDLRDFGAQGRCGIGIHVVRRGGLQAE